MSGYLLTLAGILGLLIGSFLNVVVYRVPAGKSLLPASACPKCDAPIRPWQNIPVLSWLLLRGRCASCDTRISARYPLVEAATAVAFFGVTCWWLWGGVSNELGVAAALTLLVTYLYLAAVSIALALIDIDTFRLPDAIVLPSIVVCSALFAAATIFGAEPWAFVRALIGAAILGLFYALFWFFWPGGMGFGDVKLAVLLGLALGWIGWGALVVGAFAAFVFGGLFGIALIVSRRAGRKSRVPFGPWMLLGAWFGIVAGEGVAAWYLTVFFAA